MNDETPLDPTLEPPMNPTETPPAAEPAMTPDAHSHHLKPRLKHVSLGFMGDGWDACGIDFRALRFSDLAKFAAPTNPDASGANDGSQVIDLLKSAFISGTGLFDDGSTADLSAEDLDQLDIESITELSRQLTGQVSPNA